MTRIGASDKDYLWWITKNGNGPKLMKSNYYTEVDVLCNRKTKKAYLKDENTIVVMNGSTSYEFKL